MAKVEVAGGLVEEQDRRLLGERERRSRCCSPLESVSNGRSARSESCARASASATISPVGRQFVPLPPRAMRQTALGDYLAYGDAVDRRVVDLDQCYLLCALVGDMRCSGPSSMWIVPECVRCNPPSARSSSVDFPAPVGPMMAYLTLRNRHVVTPFRTILSP